MDVVRGIRWVTASAAVFSVGAPALAGPEWTEPPDAGSVPGDANVTTGLGPLSGIKGALTGAVSPRGATGPGDFQDMFAIEIVNPQQFSAFVVPNGSGAPTFDTQLWLFSANGQGVLGNDDNSATAPGLSGFFNSATDMSGSTVSAPGRYFLAISGAGSDPVDDAGGLIFRLDGVGEVSGPDGSVNPIAQWSGPGAVGEYEIQLTGVTFADQRFPPDLDGSGCVGSSDLGMMLAMWGPCFQGKPCPADLDHDGVVGSGDLGILLAAWGCATR